ncbi:putative tellurite resistance protein [Fictibacillus macauensis ZFHKF-1]|uniref:Putative tellurite resistance protein n=1 Tax=Fictibacillus macauensis ZFHKF-1 TaxID=1196324 RepID=I8UD77_9BACL|nr:toxic anion resistance protein [Fictibacillus macauensis]EIT84763.1 putative tellurite resistance protein [Fictibacillus macauensis ZFHKF-1]
MTTELQLQKQDLNEGSANQLREQLRNEPQVLQLVQAMDLRDQNELLSLGKEPAERLSRFSDRILDSMSVTKLEESSQLLNKLEKVMKRFDSKELTKEPGFMDKLFKRAKQTAEAIFKKYQTMGNEIDQIHAQFAIIEDELKRMNNDIEGLYQEDIEYYYELEKYSVAAELKLEEVKTTILPKLEERVNGGDQLARIELENVHAAKELLERKVDDLEKARMVAVIAAPQLKTMQRGNNDLVAKINSAFITTIPIFKMGIIQSVHAKRQKLHSDALQAFEERTNERLKQVTSDIMNQSIDIARQTGSSSIKMETIEEMWGTIVKGIDEYKKVKDEQSLKRVEDRKRLETLREDAKRVLSQ